MNSAAAKPIAPSPHPALELIALAQLAPEEAGQRLRALLLANPKYFGNIPPTSFNAVLKIQEDTTYECMSSVTFDAQLEQLRARVDIKQTVGYSGVARINGSEEFVRFYISYDGDAKWLDQGMRSVSVSDGSAPRPLAYEVILQMNAMMPGGLAQPQLKVRAILSWNSPPPAGAPNWIPVWGNVMESDMQARKIHVNSLAGLKNGAESEPGRLESALQATMLEERPCARCAEDLPSSQTDPQHRFLVYLFARSARHTLLGNPNAECRAIDPSRSCFSTPPFQIPEASEARLAAAL